MRIEMRVCLFAAILGCVSLSTLRAAAPVEFTFNVPAGETAPLAREIWAVVVLPSGNVVRLPAYFAGAGRFAVRARADERGEYRLGAVTETIDGKITPLAIADGPARVIREEDIERLPQVGRTASAMPRLATADGKTYGPIGADLAWATTDDPALWYRDALKKFGDEGLNWTRIWMAHWGHLNLDWLPESKASPPPGEIDGRIAANWDGVLAAAEQNRVYVQVVLQHHGQVTTRNNSNWALNPWNAANPGGFLKRPQDFFTSERARRFTRQKYRYIVARWGYSPAVLAWELFNEVHWVDTIATDHDQETVARWHDEMAAFIWSVDAYQHLVTTSTEDLRSPIYASMDYFQPHLYATNMLEAARRFDVRPEELGRPVFYGEMGDDHMRLTPEQSAEGVELAPIAWASLFGEGRYPAQAWDGAKLLEHGRIAELGAVARFATATGIMARDGLQVFSATVEGGPTVPFVIEPGESWHRRKSPEIAVAADGRDLIEYALVPRFLVSAAAGDGFPSRVTFQFDEPRATKARLNLAGTGKKGATAVVEVDGKAVPPKAWPPVEVEFSLSAGRHTIAIANPEGPDWVEFGGLDLGIDVPAIAAIGKRGEAFVALWLWRRDGVYALKAPSAEEASVTIDDLPGGRWRVTWWDTLAGKPMQAELKEHRGGVLRLATPPISRHAAVVLERVADVAD